MCERENDIERDKETGRERPSKQKLVIKNPSSHKINVYINKVKSRRIKSDLEPDTKKCIYML